MEETMTLSVRNHLQGTIEDIQIGDVLAHITVRAAAGIIESVITRRSFEDSAEKRRQRHRRHERRLR
jgi:molybdopterin-binding protein